MAQIEVEAGFSSGQNIWLDHSAIRTLANRPGGGTYIAFSDFFGRSSFSASGVNGSASKGHNTAGSIACNPSVNVFGGTSPYSYNWSFTSNPSTCTLTFNTNQSCTVTHTYGSTTDATYSATLQCIVSDSASRSVTVTGINVNMTVSYTG
jgi:hypothetical protein